MTQVITATNVLPDPFSSSALVTYPRNSSVELIGVFSHNAGDALGPVLPSHCAETLSRALATIPLYVSSHASAPTLSKAHDIAIEARKTLKQSVLSATSIATTAAQLLQMLRDLDGSGSDVNVKSVQEHSNTMIGVAFAVLKSLGDMKDAVSQVAGDLSVEITSGEHTAKGMRRWSSALRATALCATGNSFIAAVLSSVYSTTNPPLSQGLGITSATVGIVGNMVPCVAQWYLEYRDKQLPHREDLQSVYIETNRVIYPLFLVHKWWTRLVFALKSFRAKQIRKKTNNAVEKYEEILLSIPRYNTEMMSILNSIDGICSAADVAADTPHGIV